MSRREDDPGAHILGATDVPTFTVAPLFLGLVAFQLSAGEARVPGGSADGSALRVRVPKDRFPAH